MINKKIIAGLFKGNFKQTVSRFTRELPQTVSGCTASLVYNLFNGVKSVGYCENAVVVESCASNWGAFTLGNYINGQRGIAGDPNDSLFQHEYGHYLQSRAWGWAYLSRVGIPSLMSAGYNAGNHRFQPYEQDANLRAFIYFNDRIPGFYKSPEDQAKFGNSKGWDFYNNPLDVFRKGKSGKGDYYDYRNPKDRALLNRLSIRARWYDYLDPSGIIVGTINGLRYKSLGKRNEEWCAMQGESFFNGDKNLV